MLRLRTSIISLLLILLICNADASWLGSARKRSGGAAPVTVPNMVLYYPFTTNANPTPDHSTQGNSGQQGAVTWVAGTNGLSAHQTWTTSSATTSDVSEAKNMYSWWAKTNTAWRFYETMNGTNSTDRTADTWVATNFYSVAGDIITWGGLACGADFDEIRTYTNAIMAEAERQTTNIWQGAELGILSPYLRDNLDVWSNCVLNVTFNNIIQDGGQNHLALTTASAPTLVNVKPNSEALPNGVGAADFNGTANYVTNIGDLTTFMGTSVTQMMTMGWWYIDVVAYDGLWSLSTLANDITPIDCNVASASLTFKVTTTGARTLTIPWAGLTNKWVHFGFVWNGSTNGDSSLYIYTNSVVAVTGTVFSAAEGFTLAAADKFALGSRYSTAYNLNGKMGDFLVIKGYDRSVISNHYNATTNRYF